MPDQLLLCDFNYDDIIIINNYADLPILPRVMVTVATLTEVGSGPASPLLTTNVELGKNSTFVITVSQLKVNLYFQSHLLQGNSLRVSSHLQ